MFRVPSGSPARRQVCAYASGEAAGRLGPGWRLELPGLDWQAAGGSREQERSY